MLVEVIISYTNKDGVSLFNNTREQIANLWDTNQIINYMKCYNLRHKNIYEQFIQTSC